MFEGKTHEVLLWVYTSPVLLPFNFKNIYYAFNAIKYQP